MHKVIKQFVDLQDNNRRYGVGDKFPHPNAGYKVSPERIAELAGSENKQGVPLIAEVKKAPAKREKKAAEH